MNTRERFLNLVKGEKIDRFFRYELGAWPSTIKKWRGSGMAENVDFEDFFEMDKMIRLPIRSGYTDLPLFPLYDKILIEEGKDWKIERDIDGIVKKVLKDAPDLSMPQFIKFPVENRKDWEAVSKRLDPENVPLIIGDLDLLCSSINEQNRDVPVTLTACGAFGYPRNLLGDENFFYLLFDDPGLIKEILNNWFEVYRQFLGLVCKRIKVDCFLIWEDMCYKNGPLISPEQFKNFLLPDYTKLVSFARDCGISSVWVDSDGDITKLIPLFLESGVDALLPFEVQAGMDVVRVRENFGKTFTIIGGIDKRALVDDRESIKREVDRVMRYFVQSERYIPCLDHTVPVNVPLDNFKYYLECVRAYESKLF